MATQNIVSLANVKTWLRYPNPSQASSDDTALQWVINAADQVIEFETEVIVPKQFNEMHDGGDFTIHLRNLPLLSVENVEEGWGFINFELDYAEVDSPAGVTGIFNYSIDNYEQGIISRRAAANVPVPFHPGQANIQVQYVAGHANVPGVILLAELELIAHWWQNSQLRAVAMAGTNVSYDAVSGQVYTRDTESGDQNINIGVPYRILEMIKAYRHRPIIA